MIKYGQSWLEYTATVTHSMEKFNKLYVIIFGLNVWKHEEWIIEEIFLFNV